MEASQHLTDSEALVRAVNCLLSRVTTDNYWGDDFYEDWNPIITALISELLISCGLAPDTSWFIKHQTGFVEHTLGASLKWLNGKINPNGTLGTDFWDAVKLAAFIEREKLQRFFPAYPQLKSHITNSVLTNTILSDKSIWCGPAFFAAAIDYLDQLGMVQEADGLLQRMIQCQQNDGFWEGIIGPDGHPRVSPVWHTSQAIWTLTRRGVSEHRARINKAITWLKSTQSSDGYWGGQQQYTFYFTSYAITALLHAERPETQAITSGVAFLKANMTPDGKCSDIGGTLMCAFALRQLLGQRFEHNLTVSDYVLSRNNTIRAEEAETLSNKLAKDLEETRGKLERVNADYRRLAEKYADGEIVITKRAAFAIAILGIVLSLLVPAFAEIVKAWVNPAQLPRAITSVEPTDSRISNNPPTPVIDVAKPATQPSGLPNKQTQ